MKLAFFAHNNTGGVDGEQGRKSTEKKRSVYVGIFGRADGGWRNCIGIALDFLVIKEDR